MLTAIPAVTVGGARASCHHPQGNRLWATFLTEDREHLVRQLRTARVDTGDVLVEVGARLSSVYFPTTAVASIICMADDGASLEVGIAGCDGAIGIDSALGAEFSASRVVVHGAGSVCALPVGALLSQAAISSDLRRKLLRYAQGFYAAVAQTAVCNRHHSVEQRFCRWLLSSLERSNSNYRAASQELIANLLGVRRESITEVVGRLRREGVIATSRARMTPVNREALERRACRCGRMQAESAGTIRQARYATQRRCPPTVGAAPMLCR